MFNIQDGNIALGKNSADAAGSELRFAKSRHATDGNVTTAVNAADNIGEIVFQGSDGDELVIAAKIVGGMVIQIITVELLFVEIQRIPQEGNFQL